MYNISQNTNVLKINVKIKYNGELTIIMKVDTVNP